MWALYKCDVSVKLWGWAIIGTLNIINILAVEYLFSGRIIGTFFHKGVIFLSLRQRWMTTTTDLNLPEQG